MIRTAATLVAAVALVVAAAALVVSAWSAYRVAEAEEEQACWAEISATSGTDRAVTDFMERADLWWADKTLSQRQEMWEERTTAYDNMFDACKAL